MVFDILAGLLFGITLQPEADTLESSHKILARKAIVQFFSVVMNQVHKGHQIRCGPPVIKIGVAKPEVPFAHDPREQIRIMYCYLSDMTGVRAFGPEVAAIGENYVDLPPFQGTHHLENRGKVTWQTGLAVSGRQNHVSSCLSVPPLYARPSL